MKLVKYRLFFAWNHEEEEKWLDQMAAKGHRLESVAFCRYEFGKCQPGAYSYRLEFLENNVASDKSSQYIAFVEDTGAKHVGTYGRWIYFEKSTADGPFDLLSDNTSRIKHLKRIMLTFIVIGIPTLNAAAMNLLPLTDDKMAISRILGLINLALTCLIVRGTIKIHRKIKHYQKEQQLFE